MKPKFLTPAEQKHEDLRRITTLAATDEQSELWQVVLSLADENAEEQIKGSLMHGLTDGQRQFECGRAANAYDFAAQLRDQMTAAKQQARKMQARQEAG